MINTKIRYCIYSFVMLIFSFALENCGGNIVKDSVMNLKIEVKNKYAWLNLMPGDNSGFYFKGSLGITNSGKDTVRNLKLSELKIYRGDSLIYKIRPIFISTESKDDYNIPPKVEKRFSFQLPKGIKAYKEIMSGLPIDAEFIFSSDQRLYEYRFNNIKVEKVY